MTTKNVKYKSKWQSKTIAENVIKRHSISYLTPYIHIGQKKNKTLKGERPKDTKETMSLANTDLKYSILRE